MRATAEDRQAKPLLRWTLPWNDWLSTDDLSSWLKQQTEPVRADVFSLDQLCRHSRSLAEWHRLRDRSSPDRLLTRLRDNARILAKTHELITSAQAHGPHRSHASEWLLDNYYLIQAQIRLARQHLPPRFSRELPQLCGGVSDGLPRVYDMALELISHGGGRFDQETLERFVGAYQEVAHLRLGELWAFPIMLRLALIENIRHVALRIAWQYENRQSADRWAEAILRASRESSSALLQTLGEFLAAGMSSQGSLSARLVERLQGKLPRDSLALRLLEQQLAEHGQSLDEVIRADSQNQADDQVVIAGSISSLRSLDSLDWMAFVESQSVVEQALRGDPAGAYPRMAFASRDHYRHVVERIARRSPLNEEQVAFMAVRLAADAAESKADGHAAADETLAKRSHVGYYLIGDARRSFEQSVGYRPLLKERLARVAARAPLAVYLGSIGAVLVAVVLLWMAAASWLGLWPLHALSAALILSLLALGPAAQFAVALVNWLCTVAAPPRPIMRMDFSRGIPHEHRTLVAVPTMLASEAAVAALVEQLEVRYLGNRDAQLFFALVTDFGDAPAQSSPVDAALLERARAEIERLNARYQGDRACIFFLLHRPRQFNAQENAWMGRERKRGKLADLNRLLRTGDSSAFDAVVGDVSLLSSVRYVITLDTDTSLPRDTARELVGCMAHPLNRPRIDPLTRLVSDGYAILQPRVSTTIPSAHASVFSRLYAGEAGIDPYTLQSSDVYQDVFGRGTFVGKGIYDVYAFETATAERFPDNRVLSHDLIESCYARSALVNDVELFEGFPPRLLADMSRRHRWVRGDWQIAAWLGAQSPSPSGCAPNVLDGLSRWKIADNLRRSATPAFTLILLSAAWLAGPLWGWCVTLTVVFLLIFPTLASHAPRLVRRPTEMPWRLHLRAWRRKLVERLACEFIDFSILPYTVHCNLDAIARALFRLFISHRRLLEWTTSSEAERRSQGDCRAHYEIMCSSTVVSLGLAALLSVVQPHSLLVALPVLSVWLAGPAVAWWISQPRRVEREPLGVEARHDVGRWARHAWHYFDTYVTESDHWLPPDNVQQFPHEMVASRTSPTNMGLALAANLAAYDFGYLSAGGLVDRCRMTLDTMARLPRYRGHFLNWYETRTLEPLEPRYISTVDSGNLWGSLVVLRRGLEELAAATIAPPQTFGGLRDTLRVLAVYAAESDAALARLVDESLAVCNERSAIGARSMAQALDRLADLHRQMEAVEVTDASVRSWRSALERQIANARREIDELAFWLTWPAESACQALPGLRRLYDQLGPLDAQCTLSELPATANRFAEELQALASATHEVDAQVSPAELGDDLRECIMRLAQRARQSAELAHRRLAEIRCLADDCARLSEMDFGFLFDARRNLLTIGFNVSEHRRDESHYDLLASEARLTSFLCVGAGQLPLDHWFALGRMMTTTDDEPTLLSWSGSMFEYLMPALIMPSYPGTLLGESCRAAVEQQMRYARRRGVPWGISESCYFATDASMAYRYRAFGVPGLGLQRGLSADLVVAPYASAMAIMVAPRRAWANLRELERRGFHSEFGFFDAVDYTHDRRESIDRPSVCRTVMAHHNGMALLGFAAALLDGPMQRRFLRDSMCRAHDLLLQERIPTDIRPIDPERLSRESEPPHAEPAGRSTIRAFSDALTPAPQLHLLSNGRCHLFLTVAGGGAIRFQNVALTRWRCDPTLDNLGQFCYLRDVDSGAVWSNTYQPVRVAPEKYQAVFSQGNVEYQCVRNHVDTRTQVAVSPEDDVELRRITITNLSRLERTIELTTYAEVALAEQAADEAHRAFGGLFLECELLHELSAIIYRRRARSPSEAPMWLFHLLHAHAAHGSPASFETSRERFMGRGRSAENPVALDRDGPLSNSDSAPLDPIVSVRQRLSIEAEASATVDVVTGVAATRDDALAAIERYRDPRIAGRVLELARTHSQLMLHRLGASEAEAQLYAALASALVYHDASKRGDRNRMPSDLRRQDFLWPMSIGGDRPIVLCRIGDASRLPIVDQLLTAHEYWESKGVAADLVIWVDGELSYRQELFDHVAARSDGMAADASRHVHVLRGHEWADEQFAALRAAARLFVGEEVSVLDQLLEESAAARRASVAPRPRASAPRAPLRPAAMRPVPELSQFNGLGGFTRDGREYVINLAPHAATPAPWSNVLANPSFGALVSESSLGSTWFENAQQFRLTPWSNDAVEDPPSEAIYIRDDAAGEHTSATPQPCGASQAWTCRHGFGSTAWHSQGLDLEIELRVFAAIDQPVKYMLLSIRNAAWHRRRLSVTCFVEWVLGEHRGKTLPFVVTERDAASGAILARNPFHPDYADRVAFLHSSIGASEYTCDRTEFLGLCGSRASPEGLNAASLSGRTGAALDSAAALRCSFELDPSEQRELVFVLGCGASSSHARELAQSAANVGAAHTELGRVRDQWNGMLGRIQVDTPDVGLNLLTNGWLAYQTVACRMWGRAAFYQSSGALGFRDQLQDALAVTLIKPDDARQHLLTAASRQFCEGDVQHWWQPRTGRGVRTRISDDMLWLPFAVARYVQVTGDEAVLDERVPMLVERPLDPEEESRYGRPRSSDSAETLYEHCCRAIRRAVRLGPHGLPLFGAGDWNDGMNLVGRQGRGESVWLAMFLSAVLRDFECVALCRDDRPFSAWCGEQREAMRDAVERHAWDGEWYARGFFDDGQPLGSRACSECQIDLLPQAWAALAGVGSAPRRQTAMNAVYERLVRLDHQLVQLFDPPFDKSDPHPGYVQGYLRGVRENGGHYTHAGVWAAMAYAALGDADRAYQVFRALSPIVHSASPDKVDIYRVEPYVVAADIVAHATHAGRGGWTWYTGSAGWMYQFVVEWLLGVRVEHGRRLRFYPCPPPAWNGYKVRYRHHRTTYQIEFKIESPRTHHVSQVLLDDVEQHDKSVPLVDDGAEHRVLVRLGSL